MTQRYCIIIACFLTFVTLVSCRDDRTEPSNSYTSPAPVVGESEIRDVPSAYSTIQRAVNAAKSGDFIRVAAGTYTENVKVDEKALSLRGAGTGQTTLIGTLTIEDSSEASVEGFTIKGKVYIIHSLARISGNEIIKSQGPGLEIKHCPGSIISDNTISSNALEGILSNESDGVIGNNIVQSNGADGIVINNASPTLQANVVTDNQRDGISIRGFSHYAAPILLQNFLGNNGTTSNYDIICFGDNTNPNGSGNRYTTCLNCAECKAMAGGATYED
ncbi:hypothetical protein CSA56_08190 [candidate division KSB3 bacterium]|uniref:Right handed beta helix domain-containing protein n=1 Tax=candidate division KSB3 bacterium TaxID=2044937 RepID=A0A2G6KH74_9BACT|nr:MAG: hypothetical protein CSA56_08190 [candidate division KSB3 bacterium]